MRIQLIEQLFAQLQGLTRKIVEVRLTRKAAVGVEMGDTSLALTRAVLDELIELRKRVHTLERTGGGR